MCSIMKVFLRIIVLFCFLAFASCGYNSLVSMDEETDAAWAQVLNQYKRRSDLIPSLVKVVKAYAKHEKETLTQVVEARSKATSMQLSPKLLQNPKTFQSFQKAQGALSSALSRLMLVVERYPNLKANTNFSNLQASLEGTENRLAVARKRYIASIKQYNVQVRKFPSNLTAKLFGFAVKPNFSVENEEALKQAPEIDFE